MNGDEIVMTRNKMFGVFAIAMCLGISGCVLEPEEMAIDDTDGISEKAGLRLGCFVDTPDYDTYTSPHCYGAGPSTASFQVLDGNANYTYIWSDSSCPDGGTAAEPWCTVPIGRFEDITMYVTVKDSNGATIANLQATAHTEPLW